MFAALGATILKTIKITNRHSSKRIFQIDAHIQERIESIQIPMIYGDLSSIGLALNTLGKTSMTLSKSSLLYILLISVSLSFSVAFYFTYIDWQLNPGMLFENEHGIQWRIIFETFNSWFFPLSFATTVFNASVYFIYLKIKDVFQRRISNI